MARDVPDESDSGDDCRMHFGVGYFDFLGWKKERWLGTTPETPMNL
jgi:hypothetical protein